MEGRMERGELIRTGRKRHGVFECALCDEILFYVLSDPLLKEACEGSALASDSL